MTKYDVSIRAPRFSQGGSGYVTADTIEVYMNRYRILNSRYPEAFFKLARLINRRNVTTDEVHAILDEVYALEFGEMVTC